MRDAIIIGAGHNGLVTAAYLAQAGLDVLVLERRGLIGGACATEELVPGFHFSSCSFLCYALSPQVAYDLRLRHHGLHIYPLEPLELRPFPDGRSLTLYRDEARNVEAIRAFSEHDAEAYPRWNAMWARASEVVNPYRLQSPPIVADLFARVRGTDDEALLERLLTTGFADLLDEWFESEHVKAALVHSGDVGDPRGVGTSWPSANLAGGAIDVLAEAGNTVGIVRGGMGSISAAIAAEATMHGAEIRTGAPVRRVVIEDGRAVGVELEDGRIERARVVVSNADPKRTFLSLVDPEHLSDEFVRSVGRLRTKVAYLKFHAAMRELPDFSRFLAPDAHPRTVATGVAEPVHRVVRAGLARRRGRPAVTQPGDVDPDPDPIRRHDRAARQARAVDLRDVRTGSPARRHLGRAAPAGRRGADRRGDRVRAQLPGCDRAVAAVHPARHRASCRHHRRQHPPPRHDPVATVRVAAAARLQRLPHADREPLAVWRGHASGW